MKINVLVQNVSLIEGMAGSMRVKNILEPLKESGQITLSNLALTHTYEKNKIGESGNLNGIKYLYIGYTSPLKINEVIQFYKKGNQFLSQQYRPHEKNILYNYGYPDIKNILLVRKAKKLGYKIVFDIVEDNRTFKKFSGILGWLRWKTSVLLIKRIKNFADRVIVISNHLEKMMKDICENSIPVNLVPITVNLKHFPYKEWTPVSDKLKLFYGGSFYLGKDGIEFLIDAFSEISKDYPQISLLLSGKSVVGSEMDIILSKIEGNPNIKFLGYLSTEEYFKVLNSCDIFCMPRNNSLMANTGFPFKLGEYLATGKAVISTNVGDVPLYLTNKKNSLLISPESVEELVEAIKYCIENPQEIKRMGAQARKVAIDSFCSDSVSRITYQILGDI